MEPLLQTPTPSPTAQLQPSPTGSKRRLLVATVVMALVVLVIVVVIILTTAAIKQNEVAAQSVDVVVTKMGFSPATIKIKKGQTVQWTDRGTETHRIVADPDPTHNNNVEFDSEEPFGFNESYAVTFDTPGTFNYHDQLNPVALKGTVIVEQ